MKKLLLATGLLVAGAAPAALAQDNVLKVNIFSPLVKTGSFFYERKLNESSSFQLGGLFTNWEIGDTKITGFAITPEYRFYLSESKEAPRGFYVGPFVRYQNLTLKVPYTSYDNNGNITTEDAEASLNTFGGGVVVGHQWLFKDRFSLDLFLGPQYNSGSLKLKSSQTSEDVFDAGSFDGFGIRTGVTFGLAF